jgi:hypothetical protein
VRKTRALVTRNNGAVGKAIDLLYRFVAAGLSQAIACQMVIL